MTAAADSETLKARCGGNGSLDHEAIRRGDLLIARFRGNADEMLADHLGDLLQSCRDYSATRGNRSTVAADIRTIAWEIEGLARAIDRAGLSRAMESLRHLLSDAFTLHPLFGKTFSRFNDILGVYHGNADQEKAEQILARLITELEEKVAEISRG